MLAARELRKSYRGTEVVHGVDLEVREGRVMGLLGANGAGKTTTIKQMVGVAEPTSGECLLDGVSTQEPETRRRIGYLPEESALYEEQTPMAYLQFFGSLYGLKRPDSEKRATMLLQRLRLEERHWKRPMATYSKGMRRKVAIARTLLHDPDVVVLDEPTSGLDPFTAREVGNFIRELQGEGKAILLTAHNLQQVQELCDEIAIMKDGRIEASGSLDSLRHSWGDTQYQVRATVKFPGSHKNGSLHEAILASPEELGQALGAVEKAGGTVLEVETRAPQLEDILRAVVGA